VAKAIFGGCVCHDGPQGRVEDTRQEQRWQNSHTQNAGLWYGSSVKANRSDESSWGLFCYATQLLTFDLGSHLGATQTMAHHKFLIGQLVQLAPAISRNIYGGTYEVTKQFGEPR